MKGGGMSPKDKNLRVRLTDEDFQKLEAEAKKAGFLTISEYVRYMTIGEGRTIQEDITEIKTIIKKLDKK
jgi:hypothetical protein